MTFDVRFVADSIPFLMAGLQTTLVLVGASLLIGIVIGIIGCFGKLLGRGPLYWLSYGYVGVFRGIPETVLIFWIYYCGPLVLDVRLSSLGSGILALSVVAGAYLTEIFRAGVQAVPRGQVEAASALGLTPFWIGWHIVVPQAVRLMLPTFVGFITILLKNSALISAIGLAELFYQASVLAGRTYKHFEIYTAVGAIYFALIFPLSLLAQRAEGRIAARLR